MKKVCVSFFALISVLLLSGCGSSGSNPAPAPGSNPVPSIPSTPDLAGNVDIPSNGTVITPGNAVLYTQLVGEDIATTAIKEADHPAFSDALEIAINQPSGEFWRSQLHFPINSDMEKDDVLLIRLFFRTINTTYESGNGFVTVFIEGPQPDYEKYIQREITSDTQWVEYLLPLKVGQSFPSGALPLRIGLGAGDRPQTVQIGGVEVYNFKQMHSLDSLPATQLSYLGREADASWRSLANERIEQHRKSDFTVIVKNAEGIRLDGVNIHIEFLKHAYHFGSVIAAERLLGQGQDSQQYRQTLLRMFNQSGTENDLKWPPWAGEWGESFNQSQTLQALQWLKEHDFYARGHVLVWPSKRNLPNLLSPYLPDDPSRADPQVLDIVTAHIDEITTQTAGLVDEWDVLNEPYDNHYLMDAFGDEVMTSWFARARQNLPDTPLYINDYSILSAGGRNAEHQQHYEDTIAYLIENNAPVTGIGLQSHFGDSPTSIETVYELLERYHQAFPTLAIRATEFDIRTLDEQLQADYTRDFLTIMFSHPATVGVQAWGFWAGQHWIAEAAMYTLDWREKPNAQAWYNTIYKTWWNDFSGNTNAQGKFIQRGFHGKYRVTVSHQGSVVEDVFFISKDSENVIEITLP